jgi:hypothetical protein
MTTATQPQSPPLAPLPAPLAHAPARAKHAAGFAAPGLLLGRVLVLFWAGYFSIIALTNLVDLLDSVGAIRWTFLNSGNFEYLHSVVKIYGVGSSATTALLVGAVVIEAATAAMFWRALVAPRTVRARSTLLALTCAAAVWITFIFATELFVAYPSESVFRQLLLLTVTTAVCVTLVPEE